MKIPKYLISIKELTILQPQNFISVPIKYVVGIAKNWLEKLFVVFNLKSGGDVFRPYTYY